MSNFKKVALISTFCDTEEKLNILEENIVKIKSLGIDVMAISPIEIPYDIIKLCDFFHIMTIPLILLKSIMT